MSKMKKLQLFDKSKFFDIEIDEYSQKVSGRLYHGSIAGEIHFSCFLELAIIIEKILDYLKDPMREFEMRSFQSRKNKNIEYVPILNKNYKKGELLSIKLRIEHRNNVTWQGMIIFENNSQVFEFESFMELIAFLQSKLPHKKRIANNNTYNKVNSTFEILDYIEDFYEVAEVLRLSDISNVIKLRMLTYFIDEKNTSDFYIKIMYLKNNSCQGSIYWKEEREKISFRSFLELIMLMDITIRKKEILFHKISEEKQYVLK